MNGVKYCNIYLDDIISGRFQPPQNLISSSFVARELIYQYILQMETIATR